MQILVISALVAAIAYRFYCSVKGQKKEKEKVDSKNCGYAEYIGEQQVQADFGELIDGPAGFLAVLADGIGKEKRGYISSHLAVHSVLSLFQDYQVMPNPIYFFKRGFHLANSQILKALDDREGGTSLACVLISKNVLYYALAGNIKIALFRGENLIPLSEGHTINKLAENAYKKGRLTRQKALFAMKEERLYNYVGQDGFREMELFDTPVHLKKNDRIILMTKGVFEALPWQSIEESLGSSGSPSHQAKAVINRFADLSGLERDNGSIIVISANSD